MMQTPIGIRFEIIRLAFTFSDKANFLNRTIIEMLLRQKSTETCFNLTRKSAWVSPKPKVLFGELNFRPRSDQRLLTQKATLYDKLSLPLIQIFRSLLSLRLSVRTTRKACKL